MPFDEIFKRLTLIDDREKDLDEKYQLIKDGIKNNEPTTKDLKKLIDRFTNKFNIEIYAFDQ